MSKLQRAIELAVRAHRGQEDPPGEPYILHPMRVMLSLPESDHRLRMVGILHDAVERGSLKLTDLKKANLPKDVIEGVKRMTHADDVTYADYVVHLKKHKLARAVKIADLLDNADLRHVDMRPAKSKKDKKRVARYALSYKFLTDQMSEKQYRKLMKGAES